MDVMTGKIGSLWRFPVKSMQGDAFASLEVTSAGITGDRAFALQDVETGKLVSAKNVKYFPGMLDFHAAYVAPPRAGVPLPAIRVTLPDGATVDSDHGDVDARLSAWFRRDVRLLRTGEDVDASADARAANTEPHTSIQARVGPDLSQALGLTATVPISPFVDLFPCSLITSATLARLHALAPASNFDERRFRMNVTIDCTGEDFVENHWLGSTLALGADVRVYVSMADPRCALTTLAQKGLAHDPEVLRTMNAHNRLPTVIGEQPCAGVYVSITEPGVLKVGDGVRLLA